MTIHDMASSHLRAGGVLKPKELNGSKGKDGPKEVSGTSKADKVEISDEGRALAAGTEATVRKTGDLPPERVLEIRQRIESGWYDTPEIAGEVARRIYHSGDLGI